jgi:ribosomal protein S18 acetylase RimI-like enzyme
MTSDKFLIEPFDPAKHDRTAFSCGVQQVDNYFQKTAGKLVRADNVRLFVMVAPDGRLVGFHAINSHAINYAELPDAYAKNRARHGEIPAAYISMIGRDVRFKGARYGTDLLVDALRRIAHASTTIGIAVVLLDVLDCGDPKKVAQRKALYSSFGFKSLPANEMRMFLPIATVRALIDELDRNEPSPIAAEVAAGL